MRFLIDLPRWAFCSARGWIWYYLQRRAPYASIPQTLWQRAIVRHLDPNLVSLGLRRTLLAPTEARYESPVLNINIRQQASMPAFWTDIPVTLDVPTVGQVSLNEADSYVASWPWGWNPDPIAGQPWEVPQVFKTIARRSARVIQFLQGPSPDLADFAEYIAYVRAKFNQETDELIESEADHWAIPSEYVIVVDPLSTGSAYPCHVPTGDVRFWLDAGAPLQDFVIKKMVESGVRIVTNRRSLPAPVCCSWSPETPIDLEALLAESRQRIRQQSASETAETSEKDLTTGEFDER